ncbi:MAG: hypothetical protein RLZZ528_1904, partial [Pseudomonadota bacterium]
DCVIDLRMAQLTGANAGGYVSWNDGIVGGYTIANKAFIENASGGLGNDELTGNQVKNEIWVEEGNDTVTGGLDNDSLHGGDDDDRLIDTDGNDWLYGDEGFDTVNSGVGNDKLFGGADDDVLNASTGNDKLAGEQGNDTMTGGLGKDVFRFFDEDIGIAGAELDKITDFVRGTDKIEVKFLDADINTVGVTDEFNFSGTTAAANSIWYEVGVGKIFVYADVDGDAVFDHAIEMTGLNKVTTSDFIFA